MQYIESDLFAQSNVSSFDELAICAQEVCQQLEVEFALPKDCLFVTVRSLANNGAVIRIGINEPSSPFGKVDASLAANAQGFLRLEKPTAKKDAGNVFIWLDQMTHEVVTHPSDVVIKECKDSLRVAIPLTHFQMAAYLKAIITEKIRNYRAVKQSEFGCCHLYKDCSQKGECVHENLLFASACIYRRNLKQGKRFY